MNSLNVGGGSPGRTEYRSHYDIGTVRPGGRTGQTYESEYLQHYLSRDETDGTRRARCGHGSGEYPVPGKKIPWRSLDEEKDRPGSRRSDWDPEHEGRA